MNTSPMPLANTLFTGEQDLLRVLSGPDFYVEGIVIGAMLALAAAAAACIRSKVHRQLERHPPRHIDAVFITKPLALLAPLLAALGLGLSRPWVAVYTGGVWMDAAAQLCLAYLAATCARLVVRSKAMGWFLAGLIMVTALLDVTGFMQPVSAYLDTIAFAAGKFRLSLLSLIHGLVILVIVFWLAHLSASTLESYLRRSSSLSYNARELTVKFFRLFVYFIALIATLSAVGVDLTAFAVFGGALGVGIGLGLQKITANFVSGITLLLEKSIKIGDLVEIGGVSGWIRQLNIRYTLIETPDGKEMMVPNEDLASTRVTNWTHSSNRGRIEIAVGIAYDSDVALARRLMLEAAQEHPLCLKDPEIRCWMTEFADSSLNFLLVFWIPDVSEGRFGPKSEVMISILEKFRANGIEIPFPQRVVTMANSS